MPNQEQLIELKGHTEGPWRLTPWTDEWGKSLYGRHSRIVQPIPGTPIGSRASVLHVMTKGVAEDAWLSMRDEDARLIAAAPSLLALCTAMATKLANNGGAAWVNALYESAGIMPPALVRREALGYDETPNETEAVPTQMTSDLAGERAINVSNYGFEVGDFRFEAKHRHPHPSWTKKTGEMRRRLVQEIAHAFNTRSRPQAPEGEKENEGDGKS